MVTETTGYIKMDLDFSAETIVYKFMAINLNGIDWNGTFDLIFF